MFWNKILPNTFRNLQSTCNFLIALESACLVLIGTSQYYNRLMQNIATDLSPILCFAVHFYGRFVTYFPPTITLAIAIDRYIHVKFALRYILFVFFSKMKTSFTIIAKMHLLYLFSALSSIKIPKFLMKKKN